MFLSVVLSRLVLFCSCYVFIVCLISFASYIITSYMDDVRLSHLNKDYLLTYLLTYHFTNGRLKSIFNSIILTYFRLFTLSQKKKMLPPYPPHLKNVTTLPCRMQNFFIWLKVCCIPPNVGGSEKNRLLCVANGISGKQRHSKCSKWPPSARIHISSFFSPLITNCIVRHALLKISPCHNKMLPQLVRIADWYSIHTFLQHAPRCSIKYQSTRNVGQCPTRWPPCRI